MMTAALGSLPTSSIWAQLSTVGPEGTTRLAQFAGQHRLQVVDAMMLGTKTPAEKGELVLLVSAEPALLDRLPPVFQAIGSRTINAGERLGQATALKLAANAWVLSLTALVGQSLALVKRQGLDPRQCRRSGRTHPARRVGWN